MASLTALVKELETKAHESKQVDDWGSDADNFHDIASVDNILRLTAGWKDERQKRLKGQHELTALRKRVAELEATPTHIVLPLAASVDAQHYRKQVISILDAAGLPVVMETD